MTGTARVPADQDGEWLGSPETARQAWQEFRARQIHQEFTSAPSCPSPQAVLVT